MTDELLPCPFCGGEPIEYRPSEAPKMWAFCCRNCDAGPGASLSRTSAVAAWNKRPDALASRSSAIVEEPMAVGYVRAKDITERGDRQSTSAWMSWEKNVYYETPVFLASPQPHTGRADHVADARKMVEALLDLARRIDIDGTPARIGGADEIRAIAALTVEPVAPTKDEIRNEIARREEAGVDARVPLTGPAKFKGWSDADLRSAIAP